MMELGEGVNPGGWERWGWCYREGGGRSSLGLLAALPHTEYVTSTPNLSVYSIFFFGFVCILPQCMLGRVVHSGNRYSYNQYVHEHVI